MILKLRPLIFIVIFSTVVTVIVLSFIINYFSPRWKLSRAIKSGQIDVVKNIIIRNSSLINAKKDSLTPLIEAISLQKPKIARLLIDSGADINLKGGRHNSSPLAVAAAWGDAESVKLLICKGADLNSKNDQLETPLMAASKNGQTEIISILMEKGADANAKSKYNGRNALEFAIEFGHPDAVKMLVNRTNNVDDKKLMLQAERRLYSMPNASIEKKRKYLDVIEILKKKSLRNS